MSAVECKEPGFYKDFDERTDPGDDFGVETEDFKNGDECSYALGKQVLPFPTTTIASFTAVLSTTGDVSIKNISYNTSKVYSPTRYICCIFFKLACFQNMIYL